MPAVGSSVLPFLIRRSDTGKYVYQRDLSSTLAPYVNGDVRREWSGRLVRLEPGRGAVKISLSTGDEATARARWVFVHAQVEGLVQQAKTTAISKTQRESATAQVERLAPDAISTIAGQAKHDRLAADDEAWVNSTVTTPLDAVVVRILEDSAISMPERQLARAAHQFANGVVTRETKAALREGNPGWLDMAIRGAEMPAELFDVEGLRNGTVQAITSEQQEALTSATIIDREETEIDKRLAENGLVLANNHPDRRRLALALLRADANACEVIRLRGNGAGIETPPRPAVLTPKRAPEPAAAEEPTLWAMRERWLAKKKPGTKQADDNLLYIRGFISLHGDLPVTKISGRMIDDYLALLNRCCRNVPNAIRAGSLRDRVTWSERRENIDKPRLTRRTINAKALGAIGAALKEAERLGLIARNPCAGMALDTSKDETVTRAPYRMQDLRAIFATSIYAQPAEIPKGGRGAAAFWLPLLGMFTGARLEEMGQLLVSDIKGAAAISYIHITDVPDENGQQGKGDDRKALKTKAARRRVPIHPTLVQLGFVDFVNSRKRRGLTRLFPELELYRGRTTKEFSKWWGRWTDRHVTRSPDKSFHSFRHLFIAKLRDARVPEERIKAMVGHEQGDVTLGYGNEDGQAFSLEILAEAIRTVEFPGLDLSHLSWTNP